jgi:hypothetical protein
MSSELRDVMERYAEGLTDKEFIEFEMMSPAQRIEAMKNAGVLRDDMNNGGRVGYQTGGFSEFDVRETVVQRPAPFIESAGAGFLTDLESQLATPVDTSAFAPRIAAQNQLQQAAAQQAARAGGLGNLVFGGPAGTISDIESGGSGVASFEPFVVESLRLSGIDPTTGQTSAAGVSAAMDPFMSPFQQQVIDTTRAQFERDRAMQRQQIADAAIGAGAFGGGREGVQRGVFDAETALGLAGLEAQLRQQGFQQADAARQAAIANQQALATQVPTLEQQNIQQLQSVGTGQQAISQAMLDVDAAAAREAAYEEQQRLGFFGQQLAPFSGGFGATSAFSTATQPPPNTLNTILGVGTMAGGFLGGLGQFMGGAG